MKEEDVKSIGQGLSQLSTINVIQVKALPLLSAVTKGAYGMQRYGVT